MLHKLVGLVAVAALFPAVANALIGVGTGEIYSDSGGGQIPSDNGSAAGRLKDAAASNDNALPDGLSQDDWSSIRTAYEAGRHAAFPTEGGYRARNPGQRWTTDFDGRGFTVTPDAGGWRWGLELMGYGWGQEKPLVKEPRAVKAESVGVAYEWDEHLTEWYLNDDRGLEHGYTVHSRPKTATGWLRVKLAVRGGLFPVVSDNGCNLRFVDSLGGTVLTYNGLTVFDANGQALSARWNTMADGVRLTIEDAGAEYPLTIDPIAQQAYLKASNPDTGDWFGGCVSVCGNTVVVGARRESSSSQGVNSNQNDNSALWAGAAYVFTREANAWSQQAYLKASNAEALDFFGRSVSISGDTIVVGAAGEYSSATGVNGNQNDNSAFLSGAVYVFVRNGTAWSQQAYLKASNTDAFDGFGESVAVSGDIVVVGAPHEASNAIGIDGDQNSNSAPDSGAVYVFVRNGSAWSQEAYLKASNSEAGDFFGGVVSVSGETIVVGALHEDSDASGVNGDQGNNGATDSGAAYVFVRNETAWSQQAYLKGSNAEEGDLFGESVSISGETVVVGAPFADGLTFLDTGGADVFVRIGTNWIPQAYLQISSASAGDFFGKSVSVSGDTLVVGATHADNQLGHEGAAYVFCRSGTSWAQKSFLKATNPDSGDQFGWSVGVSGGTVVVGAHYEGSGAAGVGGDEGDNSLPAAGAAYVFADVPLIYCTAKASSAGCLASIGTTSLSQPISGASDYQVTATNVHSVKVGLLFGALNGHAAIPWLGGTLCVAPPLAKRGPLVASGGFGQDTCTGSFATIVNDGMQPPAGLDAGPGDTMNYQYWYRDPANGPGILGTALSNAVQLDFQ